MQGDFIHGESKEWNMEMLKILVVPEDIPFFQSLAISKSTHSDTFCWKFIKDDQYIVKSEYWVVRIF